MHLKDFEDSDDIYLNDLQWRDGVQSNDLRCMDRVSFDWQSRVFQLKYRNNSKRVLTTLHSEGF